MSKEIAEKSSKEQQRDPDLVSSEIAIKRAAKKARERAHKAGLGVIVMKDGKIVEVNEKDGVTS